MTANEKHPIGLRSRGILRLLGALVATATVVMGTVAVPAGAQTETVDPALCTNFYPELCMDSNGEIAAWLAASDLDAYTKAIGALARHRAGDDEDGNGVPDSVEISLCEKAGCIADWAANATPNQSPITMELCPATLTKEGVNKLTATIPAGFDKKKLVSAFTMSTPEVHYFGAYPASGKIEITRGNLDEGTHRLVIVGTKEGEDAAAVAMWRLDCVKCKTQPPVSVKGAQQVRNGTSTAKPTSRTGSSSTAPMLMAGGALVLLGGALIIGVRRRKGAIEE